MVILLNFTAELVLEGRTQLLLHAKLEARVYCEVHAGGELVLYLLFQLVADLHTDILVFVVLREGLVNLIIVAIQFILIGGGALSAAEALGLAPTQKE